MRSMFSFVFLELVLVTAAHAQAGTCPDGKPIDGVARAGSSQHCLVIRRYEVPAPKWPQVVLIYLHGDNGGTIDWPANSTALALGSAVGATTIGVQRPGYRSELGTSDGQTSIQDDDYTSGNVEILADALKSLRVSYPGKRLLLVGHSGGAAMAALVAGRFPSAADGYLLVGCPCDVDRWREWRNSSAGKSGRWSKSLSPIRDVAKIAPGTYLRVLVGDKDDNTLPKFSEAYVAALRESGNDTTVVYAAGSNHGTVRRSPELHKLAIEMAEKLSR